MISYNKTKSTINRTYKQPFTLIELLVTMAILLMLLSLIQPSLAKVINHAIELESSQDLRVLHQGTMLYSDENGNFLPMKYLKTNSGWTSLWLNSVGDYLENGRENSAFFNKKVTSSSLADYAPNDYFIKSDSNTKLDNVENTNQKFLFFEAAPRDNLNEGGAWTAWGKRIVAKEIYNTTIAQRHGRLDDPCFYSVFVDGHTERLHYIDFWENNETRTNMMLPY